MKKCEYCKKEYKEYKSNLSDKVVLRANCDCVWEKEQEIKELARKNKRIEKLIDNSRIDRMFLDAEYHVHNVELKPYCNTEWIGQKSLFIFGNYGCHKTGQITTICKALMKCLISVEYWNTSRLARLDFKELNETMERLERVDLVVLDNFGKNISMEDSRNVIFDLIDYRIHNYKSTVVITNEILEGKVDGALWDRFKMFDRLKITGDSKRGEK
jgi:DNA replication protein DnaC